jgi:vanillate O-demethylase ferredoxin subunit
MSTSTLRVRLAVKAPEAVDICRLELVPIDGRTLPSFTAGAHIDVHLADDLVRSYSLCNDPAERQRYVLGIQKDANSRGGSRAVHEHLQIDDELTIRSPRNHFELDPTATRSVLIGGGIGITPLLAMAEQLHREGADFELHYTVSERARLAFADRLASAPYAQRVQIYLSKQRRLPLDTLLSTPAAGQHLYLCGPQRLIDAALDTARKSGWQESSLHWEFFAGAKTRNDGDQGFELEIASSGRIVPVPAGQTALQALTLAGIAVPMACEEGVCGTCLTKVLAGSVDHRDRYLTPEEQAANDQFTPCCSRARTARLVLDL